jgi:predicted nucleic acid-binding protein
MAENVLVDAGFLVALLSRRDEHHAWAAAQAAERPPPWKTCESALSEAFHLLGTHGRPALDALVRRDAVVSAFHFGNERHRALTLMQKYANIPMSLADACLVRMSEILADPIILTTDSDFRLYRRHSRQIVPCVTPQS